jgi:hypothetical protein
MPLAPQSFSQITAKSIQIDFAAARKNEGKTKLI